MDERRKLLAEIEREFSSRVIHQVKTPLALMHGYALTLLERDLPEEQRRWFLEVIAKQSGELASMLDRLEELRRLHDATAAEPEPTGRALALAAEALVESHPQVEVDLPSTTPLARLPAVWLARAVEEAVTALVEGAGGGEVAVAIRAGDDDLRVEGPAAPRRASLGLYLAGRILEHFGGSLEVAGTTLVLHLAPDG